MAVIPHSLLPRHTLTSSKFSFHTPAAAQNVLRHAALLWRECAQKPDPHTGRTWKIWEQKCVHSTTWAHPPHYSPVCCSTPGYMPSSVAWNNDWEKWEAKLIAKQAAFYLLGQCKDGGIMLGLLSPAPFLSFTTKLSPPTQSVSKQNKYTLLFHWKRKTYNILL